MSRSDPVGSSAARAMGGARTLPFQQTPQGCLLERVGYWRAVIDGVPVGMQVSRPRVAPWLRVVRIPKFGRGIAPSHAAPAIHELAEWVGDRPVLRLHVEIWTEHPDHRLALAEACRSQGFVRAERPRSYARTIWMDLRPSEKELLASLHPTARRHIRAPAKRGFEVRLIEDPASAESLYEISRLTFERTGGDPPFMPWQEIIRMSNEPRGRLRLLGLFREGSGSGGAPLGFVLGMLHGEVAEYAHAGSLRDDDAHVPILYAPTWGLIRWARDRGARWWDFGGMPGPLAGPDDPRRGIADFKRFFSTDERVVGEEWVLKPPRVAAALSKMGRRLRPGPK